MYKREIEREIKKIRPLDLSYFELCLKYEEAYRKYKAAVLDGDDGNGKIKDLYIRKEAIAFLRDEARRRYSLDSFR